MTVGVDIKSLPGERLKIIHKEDEVATVTKQEMKRENRMLGTVSGEQLAMYWVARDHQHHMEALDKDKTREGVFLDSVKIANFSSAIYGIGGSLSCGENRSQPATVKEGPEILKHL